MSDERAMGERGGQTLVINVWDWLLLICFTMSGICLLSFPNRA